MMLDQHHGDVVTFLRVRKAEDGPRFRPKPHRLIVEYPVGHIVVARRLEEVCLIRARGAGSLDFVVFMFLFSV